MVRKEHNTGPSAGQWAALVFLVTVGTASVAITAIFNVGFGLNFGWEIAAVFLLVATLVGGMPLLAESTGGWTIAGRAVQVLAIALSLTAAASHVLELQANTFAGAEAGKAKAGNHAADEQRARAALDRIAETADAAALTAQVTTAEGKLAEEAKAASDAKIECSKRKKCEAATVALQALRERLGQAKARDEYKAELAALKATSKAAEPVHTVGMGESIAKIAGADAGRTNAIVGAVVLTLILALLEILSGYAFSRAGKLIATISAAKRKAEALARAEKIVEDGAGQVVALPKTRKDEALLALQVMIYQADGERLYLSQNKIAEKLGIHATTFRGWCQAWKRDGLIYTEGKGKRVALCTVRRAA